MDHNIVVISGRLAASPEIRVFSGGATFARYLITARSEEPKRRIDVVPVVQWDPAEEVMRYERGDSVWIAGAVQRRFWSDGLGSRSRIEIVAHLVDRRDEETDFVGLPTDANLPMVEGEAPV